jgi:hypothetical protein
MPIKKLPPVTDLDALPVILTIKEVSAVYRISPLTIRRRLFENTFRPLPFDKYPYRWLKDDVVKDLATFKSRLPYRAHGFAKAKPRRGQSENHERKIGSK